MTNQTPSVQASKLQGSTNNQTSKERPILFSGEMVRAILGGMKTQTRRVVKPQPIKQHHIVGARGQGANNMTGKFQFEVRTYYATTVECIACPYGVIGDRLWVKETFRNNGETIVYRACGEMSPVPIEINTGMVPESETWRPSIFMPRWASRILLEITSIRVERLQEISAEDAIAEGIEIMEITDEWSATGKTGKKRTHYKFYGKELEWLKQQTSNPVWSYETLWEKINGEGSWKLNPWVWAISFKICE